MVRGYALGAVDYIASPIVPEILQAKVKVFVNLYLLALQAQQQAAEHIVLAEERAARAAAEQATHRLSFLAQASVALAGSLDPVAITRELAGLCVPFLADICALTLVAEQGSLGTEVAWMSDDRASRTAAALGGRASARWLDDAIEGALRSGKPVTFGARRNRRGDERSTEPLARE